MLFLIIQSFTTYAGPLSLGEPEFKWTKREIIVCWQDQNSLDLSSLSNFQLGQITPLLSTLEIMDQTLKNLIQEKIEAEFSAERTGIYFTGWKSCSETDSPDLHLLTGRSTKTPRGRAILGFGDNFDFDLHIYKRLTNYSFVYLNLDPRNRKLDFNLDVVQTALHEFGHVGGLRHEHIHQDMQQDPLCGDWRPSETLYPGTTHLSAYDPQSIMNYCFIDFVANHSGLIYSPPENELLYVAHLQDETIVTKKDTVVNFRIGLSKGDVHGLRCLNLYTEQEQKRLCHMDARP